MDCYRCGKKLKDKGHKNSGYGKYCYDIMHGKKESINKLKQEGYF